MPIPRKHHFLPRWYLDRWTRRGIVWEFTRQGPEKLLKAKYRQPTETGFRNNLYTMPGLPAQEAVSIETEFLQIIDSRGAQAFRKAESGVIASPSDKAALVQFLLSMLHRSPESIKRLEERLKGDLEWRPEFDGANSEIYREGALNVFADLVQSELLLSRLLSMTTFLIDLGKSGYDFLTCDAPILISNGFNHPDAFMIVPTGPRRLLLLAEKRSIAEYFSAQPPKILSKAVNEALVVQANGIVISASRSAFNFIDERFGNESLKAKHPFEEKTGLVRWTL